jgi:C4-type Zn-finger protein
MTDPTKRTIEEIEADLEISEAEAARGEAVPLEPILKRLHEHADRLEAKAASARQRTASRR